MGEGVGAINIGDSGNPNWIGSLMTISQDDGYWVKVFEETVIFVLDAEPINYDGLNNSGQPCLGCNNGEVVYDIHFGNNLISYPFQTSQFVSNALGDAVANIYAVAGEGVAGMYNPDACTECDGWVGSLQTFDAGKGYWLVATDDFSFSFDGTSTGLTRNVNVREIPEIYNYKQSDQQAFFFIDNATIFGETLDKDDIIIIYNEDVIVGARYWNGQMTDVPAIGVDSDMQELFSGYCEEGNKIIFKVFDSSTGILTPMYTDDDIVWSNFKMSVISLSEKYVPSEVGLSNAYPNPFNPTTTLSLDVPFTMNVNLSIYDVRGRLVEELVNDFQETGRYSITWNADKHSSGAYMVKLVAGSSVEVQKIMLVK
jgi:hypothetical protein